MEKAELSEAYIDHTIKRLEHDLVVDKVRAALRRAVILLFSSYGFDSATCELVSQEFRGPETQQ